MNKRPDQAKNGANEQKGKDKEVDDNLADAESRKMKDRSEKRGEKDDTVLGEVNDD